MKKIGKISPYVFDDNLVFSLSKNWIQFLEQYPKFDVIIDKSLRLCLIGPKIKKEGKVK